MSTIGTSKLVPFNIDGTALITDKMKSICMGEFSFTIDEPCPLCAYHLDENYDDVECLCDGSEEKIYQKKIIVPWDTTKEIYKKMVSIEAILVAR